MSWSINVKGEKSAVLAGIQSQRASINYLVGKEEELFKAAANLMDTAVSAQPDGVEVSASGYGHHSDGRQNVTVSVLAVD